MKLNTSHPFMLKSKFSEIQVKHHTNSISPLELFAEIVKQNHLPFLTNTNSIAHEEK
ncbi:hypothetical protein T11_4992, partial [Trichinella zimbabwensis]